MYLSARLESEIKNSVNFMTKLVQAAQSALAYFNTRIEA